jgi:hypothetical protein
VFYRLIHVIYIIYYSSVLIRSSILHCINGFEIVKEDKK